MSDHTIATHYKYRHHGVWDDETGERIFIDGHVKPERRAIAAANFWARDTCGLVNLADLHGYPIKDVHVAYSWMRPAPRCPGDDESAVWCRHDDPNGQPVTVISL